MYYDIPQGLFEPETLLMSQWADRHGRSHELSNEAKMYWRLLRDAIWEALLRRASLGNYATPEKVLQTRLLRQEDAVKWIAGATDCYVTFEFCVENLPMLGNVEVFRNGLLRHIKARWTELPGQLPFEAVVGLVVCETAGLPRGARPVDVNLAVARAMKVPLRQIYARRRGQRVAFARQIAMYLIRELCDLSFPAIGNVYGRDHTTVLHAYQAVGTRMAQEPGFAAFIRQIAGQVRPTPRP